MQTDESLRDRASDAGAFASWAHHGASALEQGAFTSTVVGVVVRVDEENLWLRAAEHDADDVGVYHHVTKSVDLQALVGRSVRATMTCKPGTAEHLERTLVVTGMDGRVWLIARSGMVRGETHALSRSPLEMPVRAALSQRELGPLVIGTPELQCLVPVGQSALLRMQDGSMFRAVLVKRRPDGTAAYVIADASLSAERPS